MLSFKTLFMIFSCCYLVSDIWHDIKTVRLVLLLLSPGPLSLSQHYIISYLTETTRTWPEYENVYGYGHMDTELDIKLSMKWKSIGCPNVSWISWNIGAFIWTPWINISHITLKAMSHWCILLLILIYDNDICTHVITKAMSHYHT